MLILSLSLSLSLFMCHTDSFGNSLFFQVGISTYYWMFPSEAGVRMNNLITSLENELGGLKKEKTKLDCDLAGRQAVLCHSDDRQGLLDGVKKLEEEHGDLEKKLEKFSDCDPDLYLEMKKGLATTKESANRWVDNIWCLQGWMNKKFPGREKDIKQFFKQNGVTDDLDTIP